MKSCSRIVDMRTILSSQDRPKPSALFGHLRTKRRSTARENSSRSQSSQTKLLSSLKEANIDKFVDTLQSGLQSGQVDVNFHYAHGTLLHTACRTRGCHKFVQVLLEHGADINAPNIRQSHKAAIHLAVENYNLEALQIILEHPDCDVNSLTSYGDSALHYAVEYCSEAELSQIWWLPRGIVAADANQSALSDRSSLGLGANELAELEPESIKLLLRHPDIDVNILNRNHRTPLHLAIHLGRQKAIQELLEHPDIDLDTDTDVKGYTCRQLIDSNYPEFAQKISQIPARVAGAASESLFSLLRKRDVDAIRARVSHSKLNSKHHDGKYTYLQYACNYGLVQVVEILLKAGVDPNQYCPNNPQTPLMIAAQRGNHAILKILLDHSTLSFEPAGQKTALHSLFDGMFAIKNQLIEDHAELNHLKCLEYLLRSEFRTKLNIHYADANGNTPLHYAVRLNNETAVKLLLNAGAYVGRKNLLGRVPLTSISASVLEDCLDNCVSTNGKHSREDDYEIIFDYSFVTCPKLKESGADDCISEMETLLLMGHIPELRRLLKHPVLLSFLNLKWHTIAKYFYINLIFYSIFCLSLTTYICYINDCIGVVDNRLNQTHLPQNVSSSPEHKTSHRIPTLGLYSMYATHIFGVILFLRELYQFYVSPRRYFKFAENWMEMALIWATMVLLVCHLSVEPRRQLSSAVIMISWMELMLLIGRHPLSSTNIEMFKTVSLNFLKFLAWYSILLLAFALSFYILFKDNAKESNQFFRDPALAVIKSIIMLTGEFEAGSIPLFPFDPKSSASYVLFVLFVFLVAIVLFNLLNGLAVSDTQAIRADAQLVGIVSQAKLTAYIEAVAVVDRFGCLSFMHTIASYCALVPFTRQAKQTRLEHLKIFYKNANLFPYLFSDNRISVLPNNGNIVFLNDFSASSTFTSKNHSITRYCFRIDSRIMREAVKILDKAAQRRATFGECTAQNLLRYESRMQNVEKLLAQFQARLESVDKSLKQIIDAMK